MPIRFGGGLEMRSLAAAVRRNEHRSTAPTERTPSRESAGNAHPFRRRLGRLRSLAAVVVERNTVWA
jgi:hypothetical protein